MSKNKERQAAIDAVVKNAVKSGEKKSRDEYLEEFKEAQNLFNKKRKKFVRKSNGSDIYTEDVRTKLEQERLAKTAVSNTLQRLTYIYKTRKDQLKTGRNMHIPCYEKAKVARIEPNHEKYGLCAICDFGTDDDLAQILIPFNLFTDMTEEQLRSTLRISPHTFLSRRLETTIDFCVESYIKGTADTLPYFIGNRVDAMKDKCAHMWYSVEIDGSSENYRFNEGSIIEARIVGVYPGAGVMIEIFGVEYLVPQKEVAWPRFRDIRELKDIKLGENIPVKIMSLNREEGDKLKVSYTASIKRTKPNPMERALQIYQPGMEVTGKVTMINWKEHDLASSTVLVSLPHDAEVYCKYPGKPVNPGQRVVVKIGKMRGRNKAGEPFMHAEIKHVEDDNILDSFY